MFCSDEAYFYLTLPLNNQNNRLWSQSQPMQGVEYPLDDQKILVWSKVLRTAKYEKYYFQRDDALPHTAAIIQTWLKGKFGKKLVDKDLRPPPLI